MEGFERAPAYRDQTKRISEYVTNLNILVQFFLCPLEKYTIVLHSLNEWNAQKEMLNPRSSSQWPHAPMRDMIYVHYGMLIAGQVIEVNRQAKLSHSIKGIVLEPLADVERLALARLNLCDEFIRMMIYERLGPFQS